MIEEKRCCRNCNNYSPVTEWEEDLPSPDAVIEFACKLGNKHCSSEFCCEKHEYSEVIKSMARYEEQGIDPCLMKKDTPMLRRMALYKRRIHDMEIRRRMESEKIERTKRILEKYSQVSKSFNDPSAALEYCQKSHELLVSRDDASALI